MVTKETCGLIVLTVVYLLGAFALWFGIAYVVVHFIAKLW